MSRLIELNIKDPKTGKISARAVFTLIMLVAVVACFLLDIKSPSTGIQGYMGHV